MKEMRSLIENVILWWQLNVLSLSLSFIKRERTSCLPRFNIFYPFHKRSTSASPDQEEDLRCPTSVSFASSGINLRSLFCDPMVMPAVWSYLVERLSSWRTTRFLFQFLFYCVGWKPIFDPTSVAHNKEMKEKWKCVRGRKDSFDSDSFQFPVICYDGQPLAELLRAPS